MKKNNKGMTLVELIVSFMIVAVAMLYFFQTLRMVQKLYVKAVNQTDEYVEKEYTLRITDAYIDKLVSDGVTIDNSTDISDLCNKINNKYCESGISLSRNGNIITVNLNQNLKLYKYVD